HRPILKHNNQLNHFLYINKSKNDIAVVTGPVEFVGNPLLLGVWVTCVQSVGNMLFVVNALCTGYPCPGRVIHKLHRSIR
uniref:hypothetical protein n=1 Tax=Petroclostridium xylanilyticum TaxID=1792311 RepID=UPI001A9A37CF